MTSKPGGANLTAVPQDFNWGGVDAVAFSAYISLQRNCCVAYKVDVDISEAMQGYSKGLNERTSQQVIEGASAGNAADCLEAGLRMFTGCGVDKNVQNAMTWWYGIAGKPKQGGPTVSKKLRVRALSCLANGHWESRTTEADGPDVWNIDAVYRAASHANDAASLGFVSPAVLIIGLSTKQNMEEGQYPEFDAPRFHALEFLWEVVERREGELQREKERRDEKVAKAPNAYVCAAEGCGIEGTRKSGLLRCAGACPAESKPSYCSKECQTADWKRHKAICKPSETASSSKAAPDKEDNTAESSSQLPTPTIAAPTPKLADDSMHLRDDGREVRMEIPRLGGGTTTISSRTMSPGFMKEFRNQIEKMVQEEDVEASD